MSDLDLEELISAYLDGELTALEQARVEQLLETSGEARRLLEELRSLCQSLQALPQHRLPREFDLSAAVLANASRPQGNGVPPAAPPAPRSQAARTTPQPEKLTEPSRDGLAAPGVPRGWNRGLVWSALAVAAAVLIALFNLDDRRAEIARHEPAVPAVEGNANAAGEGAKEFHAPAEVTSGLEFSGRKGGDETASFKSATRDKSRENESRENMGRELDQREFDLPRNTLNGADGANRVAGKSAAQLHDDADALGPVQQTLEQVAGASMPAPDEVMPAPDVVIVEIDVTAEAAGSGAFRELLAQEAIDWSEARFDHLQLEDRAAADAPREPQLEAESVETLAKQEQLRSLDELAEASEADQEGEAGLEVIVVDASPEQIGRTLQRLDEEKQVYARWQYADSASPTTQQVTNWYRATQLPQAAEPPAAEPQADVTGTIAADAAPAKAAPELPAPAPSALAVDSAKDAEAPSPPDAPNVDLKTAKTADGVVTENEKSPAAGRRKSDAGLAESKDAARGAVSDPTPLYADGGLGRQQALSRGQARRFYVTDAYRSEAAAGPAPSARPAPQAESSKLEAGEETQSLRRPASLALPAESPAIVRAEQLKRIEQARQGQSFSRERLQQLAQSQAPLGAGQTRALFLLKVVDAPVAASKPLAETAESEPAASAPPEPADAAVEPTP